VELSDEVVAAASAGSADAVSSIYRSLAPRVIGYLRARGVEDPEGTTNDVFLAVLPRLPRLSGGAAGLRTLVFSVAHARYVDENRRRSVRPREVELSGDEDPRTAPSAEVVVLDHGVSGVLEHLESLPEDHRTAITLRVLGDLSLEETAAVMGRSVGAVKQLQRRGLEKLRERYRNGGER
jgi:RNA polymerase sigma-70 factor, ECF subfamily